MTRRAVTDPPELQVAVRPAARALALPFETFTLLAAAAAGFLGLFTDGDDTVAEALPAWHVVWGYGYTLAPVAAFAGLIAGRVAWEASGLGFLAGAIAVRVIAAVSVTGLVGGLTASLPSLLFLTACLVRTHTLASRRDTVVLAATVPLGTPAAAIVSSRDAADGAAADDG